MAGFLIYAADGKKLLLIGIPVLIHEAGHLIAMKAFGSRASELRWELGGLCIRYAAVPGTSAQLITALAGPAAGLIYVLPASHFGADGELSAWISLLLSAYNLLPVLPLDGGRVIEALFGEDCAARVSGIAAAAVTAAGVYLCWKGKGPSMALAGLCLLACRFMPFRE